MDIKYLQLIEDINQTHSLTMSAQRLGYTQSALSHSIKKIEAKLGITLLSRTNHGVALTSEAKFLLPYIQSTTSQYRAFEEAVNALHGLKKGSITIGTYSSMAIHWLPSMICAFRKTYPEIQIHVREGYADEILQWIREETVDFGLISNIAEQSFDFLPFYNEPLYAVTEESFVCPEAWQGKFPMKAFEKYPFIASEIGVDNDVVNALRNAKVEPNVQFYCKQDQSILSMVQNGLGVTLLPGLILKNAKHVKTIPLQEDVQRTLGIMYLSENQLSIAAKAFIEVAQSMIQNKEVPN